MESTGDLLYEGSTIDCMAWLMEHKEQLIISFLDKDYNAIVAASECFNCTKSAVTDEMIKSDELRIYMRIYFEAYYLIK